LPVGVVLIVKSASAANAEVCTRLLHDVAVVAIVQVIVVATPAFITVKR
jgi:hypothetical protein